MKFLFLPGYQGSGPSHWQRFWHDSFAHSTWVEDQDFSKPRKKRWLDNLARAIAGAEDSVFLIAHSLACHQVAHFVQSQNPLLEKITGALLVAPPDPSRPIFPQEALDFCPMAKTPFPFESLVIASENDPYGSSAFAKESCRFWQADFINAGELGHINADSSIADWPQGLQLLQQWSKSKGVFIDR